MAKKPKQEDCVQKVAEYMLTYGDMMTLLLCFFVLLFSFSSIDAQKFEAIVQSFSGSLGVLEGGNTLKHEIHIEEGAWEENVSSAKLETETFEKLEEKIREYLNENELAEDVQLLDEPAGLLLRFQDNVLFDSGRADVKEEAMVIIGHIADLLNGEEFKDKSISIEGHTDNVPMNSARFPSNWELSVTRATNVGRFLLETKRIDPRRISVSGYSEYHPVASNEDDEGRAKNRRVDIMILRSTEYKNASQ